MRQPMKKGMPLAALKQTLVDIKEFPATFDLDNDNSLAGMDLSQFQKLELSVRISFSGQAIAEEGDWQSAKLVIDSRDFTKPHNLLINNVF